MCPPPPRSRSRWTARRREADPAGAADPDHPGDPGPAPGELVFVALLDGRHLWLGAEHAAGSPSPVARVGDEEATPDTTASPVSAGRTSTGWRVPLEGWLDGDAGDDLVVELHHQGRPVPASPTLDPRTAGGAEPRRTPDGRWLLSWSVVGAEVRVRRRQAPAHAPVTGTALESGELVLTCSWPEARPMLLVRGDGEVVATIGTVTDTGSDPAALVARLGAGVSLAPGERARLVLDTAEGHVPLARRHHDLLRPGEAVVLPMLGDRSGELGALQLRYDRAGRLLVLRAPTPRHAG